jgi:class 3 adenylate cyclase
VKNIKISVILFSTLFLLAHSALAQDVVKINKGDFQSIGKSIEYYVDSTMNMNVEDLEQVKFTPYDKDIINFTNQGQNVWMRFSVSSQTEKELFLEVKAPMLDIIEVYKEDSAKYKLIYEGSFLEQFKERPVKTESWLVNLELDQDQASTFYIHVQSIYPLQIPMSLSTKDEYVGNNRYHNLFWGVYIGIILFAILYNFFIFLSVREINYLYYIVFTFTIALFYLGVEGFGAAYIWPKYPIVNLYLPALVSLTNVIFVLFTFRFLQITKKQPITYYLGWGILISKVSVILITFMQFFQLAVILGQMLSLFAVVYYIFAGVGALIRKIPTARFFLLAWTSFCSLVIVAILASNNIIATNFFTMHGIFIGHMTEVLLLSFALADRINWLKSENENKQKRIIIQMEENDRLQLKVNRELEQKVAERTAELQFQKDRSDELLLNILPEEVAEELKSKGHTDAKLIEHVTVMFSDFQGFTQISENLSPNELVSVINECFSKFDNIMQKYGIEKIKTMGDSYMAAGGLPSPNTTHAIDVVKACLEIQEFMVKFREKRIAKNLPDFEARIGVHTGPVVAGIVGIKKFAYDIWGDTVNTASRMESSGEVGRVNISETTYNLVKDVFECEYRGKIDAKGKGQMDMYFVKI